METKTIILQEQETKEAKVIVFDEETDKKLKELGFKQSDYSLNQYHNDDLDIFLYAEEKNGFTIAITTRLRNFPSEKYDNFPAFRETFEDFKRDNARKMKIAKKVYDIFTNKKETCNSIKDNEGE